MSVTEEEMLTVVQVAGEGGMGDDDVVEVGVELECWKISSSVWPDGDVATSGWATKKIQGKKGYD